jgi:hypothetical protein
MQSQSVQNIYQLVLDFVSELAVQSWLLGYEWCHGTMHQGFPNFGVLHNFSLLFNWFSYSFYTQIAFFPLPSISHPLLLWESGSPTHPYPPILAHQVFAGLGASSPTEARQGSPVRGRIHRQATDLGSYHSHCCAMSYRQGWAESRSPVLPANLDPAGLRIMLQGLFVYFFPIFIRYLLHLHFKCYPKSPLFPPPTPAPLPTHSHFLALVVPCTGAYKVCKTKGASFPSDGQLGHLLLHMQLEARALGLLVSSYCCSTCRVADPFSSLGTFSSSSTGGPVQGLFLKTKSLILLPNWGSWWARQALPLNSL